MANYVFQKEIAEAGINNVVPSYAPFYESYFYLQESTECDWNELMHDIGISELGVLEATGSEIVYEAEDGESTEAKQTVVNKIVNFIKEQWEKVKSIFQNLLEKIQTKMNEAKSKFKGNTIANIKKKLDAGRLGETDKKTGEVKSFGKFYTYEGLDKVAAMTANLLKSSANMLGDNTSVNDLKEKYRGAEIDVDRNWIVNNIELIVNLAFEFKFTKKSIVSAYNEVKKGFDEEVKAVKVGPGEIKVKTDHAKTAVNKAVKVGPGEIKVKTDHAKTAVKNLNKIAAAATQLFIERQSKALGLLTKVAVKTIAKSETEKSVAKEDKEAKKAAKKAEKEAKKNGEAQNESAVMESYSSEIEKLFDWNF